MRKSKQSNQTGDTENQPEFETYLQEMYQNKPSSVNQAKLESMNMRFTVSDSDLATTQVGGASNDAYVKSHDMNFKDLQLYSHSSPEVHVEKMYIARHDEKLLDVQSPNIPLKMVEAQTAPGNELDPKEEAVEPRIPFVIWLKFFFSKNDL